MHALAKSDILLAEVVARQISIDIAVYRNDSDKIPRAAQRLHDAQRALAAINFRIEALKHLSDRKHAQQMAKFLPGPCLHLVNRIDDIDQMVFFVLVMQLLVFCLYGSSIHEDALNGWQLVFPPVFLLRLMLEMVLVGPSEYWYCNRQQDKMLANRFDAICVVIQGVIWCKWIGRSFADAGSSSIGPISTLESYRTDLFLLSIGLCRLVTSTPHFRKIVYVLATSVETCGTMLTTLIICMVEFSAFGMLLFRDYHVTTDSGNEYYNALGTSLFTHFQLFIGEGWHDIMYAAIAATDTTACWHFIMYQLIVGILFGNLILGVVIDVYNQVAKVESISLRECLEKASFADMNDDEQARAFQLLCDLLDELDLLPDPFGEVHHIHFEAVGVQEDESDAILDKVKSRRKKDDKARHDNKFATPSMGQVRTRFFNGQIEELPPLEGPEVPQMQQPQQPRQQKESMTRQQPYNPVPRRRGQSKESNGDAHIRILTEVPPASPPASPDSGTRRGTQKRPVFLDSPPPGILDPDQIIPTASPRAGRTESPPRGRGSAGPSAGPSIDSRSPPESPKSPKGRGGIAGRYMEKYGVQEVSFTGSGLLRLSPDSVTGGGKGRMTTAQRLERKGVTTTSPAGMPRGVE